MLKLLSIIIERSKVEKVLNDVKSMGGRFEHIMLARGTARSDVLGVLGLDSTEKSLIVCTVVDTEIDNILGLLKEKYAFSKGGGIAFTLPLTAVSSKAGLYVLSGGKFK